ncbi:MAG: SurA N-terminal domain-containing protein, partial [Candidatus Omnitrophota bacterium]
MLNFLRKKHIAKKVLWALAVIIIPAFVLWGAGSLSKRRFPFKYVGRISGRKVSVKEFLKSVKDVRI